MFSANRALCRGRAAIVALAVSPLISACAVSTAPIIQDSTGNAAGVREVSILMSEGDEGLRTSFLQRLQFAFREHGVVSKPSANVVGDFAISTLPADITLSSSLPNPSNPSTLGTVVTKSEPRDSFLLDKCEAIRFRASLVLFDRTTGERLHRAESEASGCEGDPVPLTDLAEVLVRDALLAPR